MCLSAALVLQLHCTELLISELFLPGFPFGITKISSVAEAEAQFFDSLSESISAVKSLLSVFLVMQEGQEFAITNTGWIMLGYALSLGVRLDILAGSCGVSPATAKLLRRSLDIRHTLRHVILRLESAQSTGVDIRGDPDSFFHLLRRAKAIDAWYVRQNSSQSEASPCNDQPTPFANVTPNMPSPHGISSERSNVPVEDSMLFTSINNGLAEFNDFNPIDFLLANEPDMEFGTNSNVMWNPFMFQEDFTQS